MTEEELHYLRLQMKVQALQVLLQSYLRGFAQENPQAFQAWKTKALEIAATKTTPGMPPALAQLLQEEFREAMEDLLLGIG